MKYVGLSACLFINRIALNYWTGLNENKEKKTEDRIEVKENSIKYLDWSKYPFKIYPLS